MRITRWVPLMALLVQPWIGVTGHAQPASATPVTLSSVGLVGELHPSAVVPDQTRQAWRVDGNQDGARFGTSVASAGDINGDGYDDVIVGAIYYDNGQTDEGGAFVYLGSATGLSTTAAWTGEGNQDNARFGTSVASAGDINGDGYDDVIVGALYYDNGQTDEGRGFLYLGSATGLSTTADWIGEGNQATAYFGTSVAGAGDVNGDGYDDVIVGASFWDNGQTDEGRGFLYLGSATGLSTAADWIGEGNQVAAFFGNTVASAGDVNGDGYSDVIVGAYAYDTTRVNEGRAFLYLGSATGLSTTADWIADGNQELAFFATSVASAGDVNGDGYDDVIVGAPFYDNHWDAEGRALLYLGSPIGPSATADWTADGNQELVFFGSAVASAGDVNGDGYDDVIVGAPYYNHDQRYEGRAFCFLGSLTGPSAAADWIAEGNQANVAFGTSIASTRDVNGDGYDDVIVGAPVYSHGQTSEGAAFVYPGRVGRGN